MDGPTRRALADTAQGLELTARSVHRLMRVARTIADLRDLERVGVDEVFAAASLRDRTLELGAAA
jgi:predicted ATPase with chaperone activity